MNDWGKYLEKPARVKLYVIHTGYVHMNGNIHFNKKSPEFKSMPADKRFTPVFAYVVDHPQAGFTLLDTGLHSSFAENPSGNFGWLLGKIVKTKAESGWDVLSQLKKIDVPPDKISRIILSHLHLDHVSGLPLFHNTDVTVFVDTNELRVAMSPFSQMKGCINAHIKGFKTVRIQYPISIPPFDQVWDFFDDGSLFIIRTPGHSPGHISVLLNTAGGPYLLTFDAAHRKANIEELIPPKGDYTNALTSLKNIKAFLSAFPKTQVIFGHDPDQQNLKLVPEYYS